MAWMFCWSRIRLFIDCPRFVRSYLHSEDVSSKFVSAPFPIRPTHHTVPFYSYVLGGCFLCFGPKPDPIRFQKHNDDAETPVVEKEEEQPAQAVVQDEENAPAADPQTPPEQEVKPQVY